ncbi:thymidine phosphorylase [Uliginosibacterium sp. 31-12]|uniref:thymidine phosphorylase n=1 Tax=Uliginosibacterium sp. 31-12 TaxID=3062781 RepID=UPI0026E36732|nr:thymidine phosphorylase [Uliginosibacterium sp. 31-12]MDO6387707.1 thymidine phosphorylase [Uliginosibacterium sp. 31-12]
MLAQEVIRHKRDGLELSSAEIDHFVDGLTHGGWSDAQAASMAMAIFLNGMSQTEKVSLTRAMMNSGDVLKWGQTHLPGPVLDKHSTGGVGDKVSLPLAPILAACGAFVPMISGRGLGHTGGTLDKFDSIPGYQTAPSLERLRACLTEAGCAIIGQTGELAPADRRLYGIRDVTATVESIPLITASILSKKLAAGLQGLVMDVKTGNGAFAASLEMARALAQSLVEVAVGAGLPTRAWITDMNQVLGDSCGNALEMHEALALLKGEPVDARLLELTRVLCAELLCIGGITADFGAGLERVDAALRSGAALERFSSMVFALGGPADFAERPNQYLAAAPVRGDFVAPYAGWVSGVATRDIGLLLIELGGGRRQTSDRIDYRVGLTGVAGIGRKVAAGEVLAHIHAADAAGLALAQAQLAKSFTLSEAPVQTRPVLVEACRGGV